MPVAAEIVDEVLDHAQQRADFFGRAVEVVGRQQPQRHQFDVQLVTPAEELLDLVGAGDVAALDLFAEGLRPAPVAVAHHADVLRDLVRREPVQEASFVEVVRKRGDRCHNRLLSTPTVLHHPAGYPDSSQVVPVPWRP